MEPQEEHHHSKLMCGLKTKTNLNVWIWKKKNLRLHGNHNVAQHEEVHVGALQEADDRHLTGIP
eukprot:4423604-Prorocentrum_lima.AAC.1